MKKLTLALAVLAALLLTVTASAGPLMTLLDSVDIGKPLSEAGKNLIGWGPIEPLTHGGSYGGINDTRCVWEPGSGEADRSAELILNTGGAGFARRLYLEHLDGIADDSFEVYVMNPGGDWILVGTYADLAPASDPELWFTMNIYSFPAGKGQGPEVQIMLKATGPAWSGFGTYGQVCFNNIELWTH